MNHILTLQYGTAYLVLHIHRHVHLAHLFACLFDALSDTSANKTYVGDRKWPIMNSSIARSARVQDPSNTRVAMDVCFMCIWCVYMWQVHSSSLDSVYPHAASMHAGFSLHVWHSVCTYLSMQRTRNIPISSYT